MQRFAKTQDELAQLLGVTRKTIGNCLRDYKTAKPPVPRARDDGRYEVPAWQKFILAHDIARKTEEQELPDAAPNKPRTVQEWKAEKVRLECDRIRRENDKALGDLVPVIELQKRLGVMLAAFRTAANNIPGRAAGKLIGLKDFHDVSDILQAEVATMLRTLEACPFLPDDDEGEVK